MSKEGSWFVSTYEKYTYWLLFLEQVVQAYDRKVKLGELKADQEAEMCPANLRRETHHRGRHHQAGI